MREESYTLQEVAELLGVSKRTLQRRLREGAFPSRFLSPGPHGLETRIPAADVRRALEEVREQTREARGIVPRTAAPEPASLSLAPSDLEAVRDVVLAITRAERETLMAALHDAVVARDQELGALRGQLAAVQTAMDGLRRRVEAWMAARAVDEPRASSPDTRGGDLGQTVLAEIDDLLSRLAAPGR